MTVQSGIVCAGNWIVDIIHDISEWPKKSDLVIITDQTIGVGGGGAIVAFIWFGFVLVLLSGNI